MARLIRFQERNSARSSPPVSANKGDQQIEAEAGDWDEASQMVRHYLQLAETALKEEPPVPQEARRKRRQA